MSHEVGLVIVTDVPSDEFEVALAHHNAHSPSMMLEVISVWFGEYFVHGDANDIVFVPVVVFGTQPTEVMTTMSSAAYAGSVIAKLPVVTAAIVPWA